MVKKILIDATHAEETRVAVVEGNKLEEYDFETASKKQLKGNVYLASVTRVEPSLQAAFVEYGGNRQGFLAFSEIHPDYYQIPAEDRKELEEDLAEQPELSDEIDSELNEEGDLDIEELGGDEEEIQEKNKKSRPRLTKQYKIQEVIKKRQVILVQVLREERGNKGAAVTTYLSLAGRYCVLMPNTSRDGGVSRKIVNQQDRKRLKSILDGLEKPKGMGVIIRTAGEGRSKLEIKRDYEYTFSLWDKIRDLTLESHAPALINEESSLIHRVIRDIYNKDINDVIVTGDDAYKVAKAYMKELTPSHAKKVKQYKDVGISLFQRYQVETQISHIYDHQVNLPSGGSIVINQTEALVAIDVNSGRSIRERNIGETALKTNLEAAAEVARQLRLRDMAGLVVIDFIDMEDNRSNIQVEKQLKESLRIDRARIKVGRISRFGLLEMSRQRLRASLIEVTSSSCPSCGGSGTIPSTEVASMMVLRTMEEEALRRRSKSILVSVPKNVGMYLLNNKRSAISALESAFEIVISLRLDEAMVAPTFELLRFDENGDGVVVGGSSERNEPRKANNDRNRNRNKNKFEAGGKQKDNSASGANDNTELSRGAEDSDDEPRKPKKSNRHRFNRNKAKGKNRERTANDNSNLADENLVTNDNVAPKQVEEAPVKESSPKESSSKESSPKESSPKESSPKESSAKKTSGKVASTKKATAKKSKAKKSKAKKSTAKKSTAKKSSAKKSRVTKSVQSS